MFFTDYYLSPGGRRVDITADRLEDEVDLRVSPAHFQRGAASSVAVNRFVLLGGNRQVYLSSESKQKEGPLMQTFSPFGHLSDASLGEFDHTRVQELVDQLREQEAHDYSSINNTVGRILHCQSEAVAFLTMIELGAKGDDAVLLAYDQRVELCAEEVVRPFIDLLGSLLNGIGCVHRIKAAVNACNADQFPFEEHESWREIADAAKFVSKLEAPSERQLRFSVEALTMRLRSLCEEGEKIASWLRKVGRYGSADDGADHYRELGGYYHTRRWPQIRGEAEERLREARREAFRVANVLNQGTAELLTVQNHLNHEREGLGQTISLLCDLEVQEFDEHASYVADLMAEPITRLVAGLELVDEIDRGADRQGHFIGQFKYRSYSLKVLEFGGRMISGHNFDDKGTYRVDEVVKTLMELVCQLESVHELLERYRVSSES
ncbi:MAG: hypothetical protein ABMA14_14310 [Hyphomonadaceae bacterium]